ncbi:MAG TPA: class I SAM-dependent methyltransferase [Pseudonocardiaceae bacterium]|nr:class I SAM-dependent methyltransferase [Pseudonocardiaceae bacterium]
MTNRAIHRLVAACDWFNQARPWNHNHHYHRWLMRQLPRRFDAALDVGCGSGVLARLLAGRADTVLGVDRDEAIIAQARPAANVRYIVADALTLPDDHYQVITCVAALHHLPLEPALTRFRDWLAPGGTLVVIGLTQPATIGDHLLAAAAVPANLLVSLAHGKATAPVAMSAPVKTPTTTLPALRAQARGILPGARVRRRLFWRYTLVYRHPSSQ